MARRGFNAVAIAPHFRYPFNISGSSVAVVEQNTYEEVAQSVQVILSTPKGSRIEVPDFGVDDPVFSVDSQSRATRMLDDIKTWDDRAQARLSITPDSVDDLLTRIRVEIPNRVSEDSHAGLPQPIAGDMSEGTGYGTGGYGIEPWGE
jgi:hypothetical protein